MEQGHDLNFKKQSRGRPDPRQVCSLLQALVALVNLEQQLLVHMVTGLVFCLQTVMASQQRHRMSGMSWELGRSSVFCTCWSWKEGLKMKEYCRAGWSPGRPPNLRKL